MSNSIDFVPDTVSPPEIHKNIWTFICLTLLLLCGFGIGGYFLYQNLHSSSGPPPPPSSGPSQPPPSSGPSQPPPSSGPSQPPPSSGPPPPPSSGPSPPPSSGPPPRPLIQPSSAPYINQPEVFGVDLKNFASVFSTNNAMPTVDAASGLLKIAGSALDASPLQSILPSGYTLATQEQLHSAQLSGMQMTVGSWGLCVGSDGKIYGACPKQVAFMSANQTEKIQVLYNSSQNMMITAQPANSPTVPNIVFLYGIKPAWNSSGSFVGISNTQCKIHAWYKPMNAEPSPSEIWSRFDSQSVCVFHPSQCMYPLQVEVAGQKYFVTASQQTPGQFDISSTPSLSCILTPDGSLLFQTTQVENDTNGSIPTGCFISMSVFVLGSNIDFDMISFKIGDKNPNIIANDTSTTKFTMNSGGQITTLDRSLGLSVTQLGDANLSIAITKNQTYWAKFQFVAQ